MNWFNYVVKAQKSKQNKARSKGQSTSCSPFFCCFFIYFFASVTINYILHQVIQQDFLVAVWWGSRSRKHKVLLSVLKVFCWRVSEKRSIATLWPLEQSWRANNVAGERGNPAVSHSQWDNKQGGNRKDELSRKGESAHAQSRKRQWNYTDRRRSPGCEA